MKLVIITNIPSPYRVDFFAYLKEHHKELEITVIYCRQAVDNRVWKIDETKMQGDLFLDSFVFKIKGKYDTRHIFMAKGVKKILKGLRPSIVVGMEYNPVVLETCYWCRKNHIPYISWTDGTLNSERNINLMQKISRKYIIRNSKAYIASSSKSREAQIAYGAEPHNVFISFLGVDMDRYADIVAEKNENQLLYVGSLIKRKGVDLLLTGLADVKEDYKLIIVGDGPEMDRLQQLTERLGILNNVSFVGYIEGSELSRLYKSSSVFILPTREDCFALVILEAMHSGLPVICSEFADGAFDLIEDGKNGYIVNPYNKAELVDKIRTLLKDKRLLCSMSKISVKRSMKFHFSNTSKGFIDAVEYAKR